MENKIVDVEKVNEAANEIFENASKLRDIPEMLLLISKLMKANEESLEQAKNLRTSVESHLLELDKKLTDIDSLYADIRSENSRALKESRTFQDEIWNQYRKDAITLREDIEKKIEKSTEHVTDEIKKDINSVKKEISSQYEQVSKAVKQSKLFSILILCGIGISIILMIIFSK